jgi:rhamnulokinase
LKTDQAVPASPGAYTRAVLESLAFKYRRVLEDLEWLTNRRIDRVRIIGGGSRNSMLNQFTADATGRRVLAGPAEATALGNIAMQMLATGAASSLQDARAIIERSFATEVYEPAGRGRWDEEYLRFQQYCEYTHA